MRYLYPETVDTAALPPPGTPIRARDFAVVDEDGFAGKNLPEGTITEDPRAATPAFGERHVTAAVDALAAALRKMLEGES
jgi:creatinine amidohydrolase/Fe(II)-dependent formamide hydrolase-like protein